MAIYVQGQEYSKLYIGGNEWAAYAGGARRSPVQRADTPGMLAISWPSSGRRRLPTFTFTDPDAPITGYSAVMSYRRANGSEFATETITTPGATVGTVRMARNQTIRATISYQDANGSHTIVATIANQFSTTVVYVSRMSMMRMRQRSPLLDQPGDLAINVSVTGEGRARRIEISAQVSDPDGIRSITSAVVMASDSASRHLNMLRSDARTFASSDNAEFNYHQAARRRGTVVIVYVDDATGQSHTLRQTYQVT